MLVVLVASALILACSKPNDSISEAGKAPDAGTGPGIAETKDIAEEGFIFGLPLVMAYAITLDTQSGQ